MQRVEVSMVLVEQGNNYLFQLRSGANQTGALGFIGCFGGQPEGNETPAQTACRELSEESNLKLSPGELSFIGEVDAIADRKGVPWEVHARVFHTVFPENVSVQALEGELVVIDKQAVHQNLDKLTPATRAVFEQLVGE